MRKAILASILAVIVCAGVHIVAQDAPARLEFDVASIKKHVGDEAPMPAAIWCKTPTGQTMARTSRSLPSGQTIIIDTCARTFVVRAYDGGAFPQIVGLPQWAESERYDANVKAPPGTSRDDVVKMWRALLADRMKLVAHYETRTVPSYDLVFARADHRLGSGLRPSTLDCAATEADAASAGPPQGPISPAMAMERCRFTVSSMDRLAAGGIKMDALANALRRVAERPVIDRTGLEGYYAVDLNAVMSPQVVGPGAPPVVDAPSVFAAVQDQLGLKLQSSTTEVQVVVVDHIERPTEN